MKCFQFKVDTNTKMSLQELMQGEGSTDLKPPTSEGLGDVWVTFEVEALNQKSAEEQLFADEAFKRDTYKIISVHDITEEHFERLRVEHLKELEDNDN